MRRSPPSGVMKIKTVRPKHESWAYLGPFNGPPGDDEPAKAIVSNDDPKATTTKATKRERGKPSPSDRGPP
jgi:hypothetical protein